MAEKIIFLELSHFWESAGKHKNKQTASKT
jgi:hypothetical protein